MSSTGEKVEHVKRARQTRSHTCHWPGCGKQVKPAQWGCIGHWLRLPPYLRRLIWAHYRIGQEDDMRPSRAYIDVARQTQDWIREYEAERHRSCCNPN